MVIDRTPIETTISPDILDTIGKTYKFKHAKGVAEWLKNSLDNYLRLRELGKEPRNGNWPVFLCLLDAQSQKNGPNLAVIDFGGTTLENTEKFLLNWGSRHWWSWQWWKVLHARDVARWSSILNLA